MDRRDQCSGVATVIASKLTQSMVLWAAISMVSCSHAVGGRLIQSDSHGRVFPSDGRVNISQISADQSAQKKAFYDTVVFSLPVSSDGEFSAEEKVPPGSYLVEALIPGFEISSQILSQEQLRKIELPIRPLPTNAPKVRANLAPKMERGEGDALLQIPIF